VDVFFVISGFIMWVVSYQRPPTPGGFLLRRIERIVPLYWAVTLGTAAAAIIAPFAFPRMTPSLSHVLGSILFVPHRDPTGAVYPLIAPGWSLNYEMFFYLIFSVGLLLSAGRRLLLVVGALLVCVAAGRLFPSDQPLWATYTDPLMLEFVAGMLLGAAYTAEFRLPPWLAGLLVAGGLAGFAATFAAPNANEHWRLLVWGAPALMLVSGAIFLERSRGVPRWPALHLVGDASYSIYLVHALAISFVARVVMRPGAPVALELAAFIVAGLAAGLVAYFALEKPMLRLLHGRRKAAAPRGAPRPAPEPAAKPDLV
jgi:exopolysaccharide production protein ExoZ